MPIGNRDARACRQGSSRQGIAGGIANKKLAVRVGSLARTAMSNVNRAGQADIGGRTAA
jgi:hypothetical protein